MTIQEQADAILNRAAGDALLERAADEVLLRLAQDRAALLDACKQMVDHYGDPLKIARAAIRQAERDR